MTQHVLNLMQVMHQVAKEQGLDPLRVFGVTNYVDSRLYGLIMALQKEDRMMTRDQMQAMAFCLTNFLNHSLEWNEALGQKAYFLPRSGWYTLRAEESVLRALVSILQGSSRA